MDSRYLFVPALALAGLIGCAGLVGLVCLLILVGLVGLAGALGGVGLVAAFSLFSAKEDEDEAAAIAWLHSEDETADGNDAQRFYRDHVVLLDPPALVEHSPPILLDHDAGVDTSVCIRCGEAECDCTAAAVVKARPAHVIPACPDDPARP
jgi:hypothetical protein